MRITIRNISVATSFVILSAWFSLLSFSQNRSIPDPTEQKGFVLPANIEMTEKRVVTDVKKGPFTEARFLSFSGSEKRSNIDDDLSDEIGKNELTLWGGYSPDTTTALKFGVSPDARFGIAAVRYTRRFNNSDWINLKYTADVVPVAVQNFRAVDVQTGRLLSRRETAYGFGASPFGFQLNFRPKKKIQPFAGFSGGFIFFNKDIPNSEGKKLNFILPLDFGVEFRLKNQKAIIAGYKLFHVSNAFRGEQNPGYDHNLFYVGYTFFSK